MNRFVTFCFAFVATIALQACASNYSENQALSKDAQIIQSLQASGKDLSKVRKIEFFLYFPAQTDAQVVANSLQAEGFGIQLSKDDFKKMWLVLATKKIMPNEMNLIQLRKKFESLTQQTGGKYLDWGTPISE